MNSFMRQERTDGRNVVPRHSRRRRGCLRAGRPNDDIACHEIQEDVGQRRLRSTGDLGDRTVGTEHHGFVVLRLETPIGSDLVDDEQVAALRGQFGATVLEHGAGLVAGLRRETDDDLSVAS